MKIKYNLKNNYDKYNNEAQGIYFQKNKIKKSPKKKIYKFLTLNIIYIIIGLTINIFNLWIFKITKNNSFYTILDLLSLFLLILSTIQIISYFVILNSNKNKSHKGYLLIDEFGVTDYSEENITIGFGWEKIEFVVITKNIICFITTGLPIFIFVDIEEKEKILEAINKYNSEILIIDKSKEK